MMAAATRLEAEDGDYKCSGSYVSDEGHILTAAHCIDDCIFDNKRGHRVRSDGVHICQLKVNQDLINVAVLRVPVCKASKKVDLLQNTEHRGSLSKKDFACIGDPDMVILLPEDKPEAFSCLPLATEHKQGDSVSTFGFPRATTRDTGNSNGEDLYFSEGKILKNHPYCSTGVPGSTPWRLSKSSHNGMRWFGHIRTDVDVVKGSSGGPLVNSSGEVIGVAAYSGSGVMQNEQRECKGASFFEPTNNLVKDLKKHNPALLDQLKCTSRKVNKDL